uniref:Uncharacterized protein n=2 Tax=viral metagenome TaxID=1070528 RepID=A0A6M3M890_9ZZZZ
METGYVIKEGAIVSRVAEGAIAFATGIQYAPVIEGTAANQVKAATAAAITVVGFVKKPWNKDSIADKDAVDVLIDGLILMPVAGAVVQNDLLAVDTTVTQLVKLTPDTTTAISLLADLRKKCAKAKSSTAGAGNAYVSVEGL